jgi:hypothetical protein
MAALLRRKEDLLRLWRVLERQVCVNRVLEGHFKLICRLGAAALDPLAPEC